jgi:hypothetical protein
MRAPEALSATERSEPIHHLGWGLTRLETASRQVPSQSHFLGREATAPINSPTTTPSIRPEMSSTLGKLDGEDERHRREEPRETRRDVRSAVHV